MYFRAYNGNCIPASAATLCLEKELDRGEMATFAPTIINEFKAKTFLYNYTFSKLNDSQRTTTET